MPPLTNSVPKIQLSPDSRDRLIHKLQEMVESAVEFHGAWEDLHNSYLRSYLCIPEFEQKNEPWPGAANVFLPMTRVTIEAILAQEYDAMFSNSPFVKVTGFEGQDIGEADILSKFYEWVYTEVLPFRNIASDYLFDNALDGTAVVKPRWDRDRVVRRETYIETTPEFETVTEEAMGIEVQVEKLKGTKDTIRERVRVEETSLPRIDNTDMCRIFVSPDTECGLQWPECPWYYQEQLLDWDALVERRRHGYDGIDEDLKMQLRPQELTENQRTIRKEEDLAQSDVGEDKARVMEFYMRWPMPMQFTEVAEDESETKESQSGKEEDYWEEVIVTFIWDTKKIARLVPLSRIYPDGKRPHVDNRYCRLPRSFYGMGVPKKLWQVQEMTNSDFNQMTDYGTLQNLPFYFYEPASTGLMPDVTTLAPGEGVPVQSARGVLFPRFQGDTSFWLAKLQQLQVWAERDSAVNDLTLGRNPSTPNAPRTFRGMATMIQQQNLAFGRLVSLHAEPMVEIFRRIHALYRRYAPSMLEFRLFNQETGLFKRMRMSRRALDADVDFQFVLNPNRSAEQSTNQALFQLAMATLPQATANPIFAKSFRVLMKELWTSHGKRNFDEIWPESLVQNIQTAAIGQQMMAQQPGMRPPGMRQGGAPQQTEQESPFDGALAAVGI